MWCIMLTDLQIWPLLASLEWDALHHGIVLLFLSLSWVQQFCDPMDCSPAGSSVHRISQERILEQVAISFSKSWTTKKTKHWRIYAFELWFWRRLLRVPWTARRSNQSILKEINPEYSLEGLMLKLKLQYFGHLMWRADSLENTLILEKIGGKRRREWQRKKWLDSITDSMDMNLSKLQEMVKDRGVWHATVHGVTKNQTWLSNWRKTTRATLKNIAKEKSGLHSICG